MTYTFHFYKEQSGRWFFDDLTKDIIHEEMVEGVPEILNFYAGGSSSIDIEITSDKKLVKENIYNKLTFIDHAEGGIIYGDVTDEGEILQDCWLCPTFWQYFKWPGPQDLYFRVLSTYPHRKK